jgi:hypothetical protein
MINDSKKNRIDLLKSMKEEGNDSRGVKQEINMLNHKY